MIDMPILTDQNLIHEAITRAVEKIYPSSEAFQKELSSGRRLRIYYGVDPTSPHLHLGHAIPLFILRRLQDLGHEIIFLIGDFTARIGDPTDKLAARKPLSAHEVKANFTTFKKQASRIIKFSAENKARVAFNSKWLAKMNLEDVVRLAQYFTVQQMMERDMFEERMRSGKPIGLHEFLYPLLQGYDSVALDVDVEIGGNDQTFNMLMGRDLLRSIKAKEKFVLAAKLLVDPGTGKKLGKTEGVPLINLDDAPGEMFGKIMAMGDGAIAPLAEYCTTLSLDDVLALQSLAATKPRDAKLKVAEAIVAAVTTGVAARKARKAFIAVFSGDQKPEAMPEIIIGATSMNLTELLFEAKLAPSKSEARRLVEQGGVRVNDEKKSDPNEIILLGRGIVLQVGPRRFVRVRGSA
jgi:tyrosyl-tRNA synthetase